MKTLSVLFAESINSTVGEVLFFSWHRNIFVSVNPDIIRKIGIQQLFRTHKKNIKTFLKDLNFMSSTTLAFAKYSQRQMRDAGATIGQTHKFVIKKHEKSRHFNIYK